MEIEDIKIELQDNERRNLNGSEGDQLEQLCTVNAGQRKQNLAPTTEEGMENYQQRNDISELKKIETAYYQVKKEIKERPRLQKLPNMFNKKNN